MRWLRDAIELAYVAFMVASLVGAVYVLTVSIHNLWVDARMARKMRGRR